MKTLAYFNIFILFLLSNSIVFSSSDFISSNRIVNSIQNDKKRELIKKYLQEKQIKIKNHGQPENNSEQLLPDWQRTLLIIEPFNKYARKDLDAYLC